MNRKEKFLEEMRHFMEDATGMDWKTIQVAKNQSVLDGLVAKVEDGATPVMYVNDLYERVTAGMPFESACTELLHRYFNINLPKLKIEALLKDWENAVTVDLVAIKGNQEYLKDKAFTEYLDMAKIYRIQLPGNTLPDARASVVVTEALLQAMGTSLENLDAIAMRNSIQHEPLRIDSMQSILHTMIRENMAEDMAEEIIQELKLENDMYILSNASKVNGAIAMLYPHALDAVCKVMDTEELYVLPASRHEVICVRAKDMEPEQLLSMVKEINATQVAPEDRLTDQVYAYNAEEGLTLATDEPIMTIIM